VLLLVGKGPYERKLRELAGRQGVADAVVFTGGVPFPQLPEHYAAGDVFAMPCRTRRRGFDVEGLGIVYLEASALGLPVLAGDSGGAPEAVREGETGFVVAGTDVEAVTDRLVRMLCDATLRQELGTAGRGWVAKQWPWDVLAGRLTELLQA
jgi:phosphatidylinositol alpha-1,6-mannosyltransferase